MLHVTGTVSGLIEIVQSTPIHVKVQDCELGQVRTIHVLLLSMTMLFPISIIVRPRTLQVTAL